MMETKPQCAICAKTAVAFRLEADGNKTFLCADHLSATADEASDPPADEAD
jgi:hypothetical protein